jgi:hypothetical protein
MKSMFRAEKCKRILTGVLFCVIGVCVAQVFAAGGSSTTEDFSELKILNNQVFLWVQNIVKVGGFVWLLIEAVGAWTQGRIAQAATWFKLLGIIAGILMVSQLDVIWTAIFKGSPIQ